MNRKGILTVESKKNEDIYFDEKNGTSEIEIAMKTVRSLNGVAGLVKAQGSDKQKKIDLKMAEGTVQAIKNHYVKGMVLKKIEEVKKLIF